MEKVFLNYSQQIELLRERGMSINNEKDAEWALRKIGYFKLISGYKHLFLDRSEESKKSEKFINGVKFEELFVLYQFDKRIKSAILEVVLELETQLKSAVSYTISERYGHDNYLIIENFDQNNRVRRKIISFLKKLSISINECTDNRAIDHYKESHGYIPMWVLVRMMSFGRISRFFGYMKEVDRAKVAKEFNIKENELRSVFHFLTIFRNACAHDEVVFNLHSRQAIPTFDIHDAVEKRDVDGNPLTGKYDVFAVVFVFKKLLIRSTYQKFISKFISEIEYLEKNIKSVSIQEIFLIMGIPNNWRKIVD